jgi:hypothetical protein
MPRKSPKDKAKGRPVFEEKDEKKGGKKKKGKKLPPFMKGSY